MKSQLPFRHLFFFLLFTLLLANKAESQVTSGISVQGIARDAEKAAIGDELMTFLFEILDGGNSYYKEDVQIRTDAYGVFSHIIGTGNISSGSGNFNEIPFSQKLMKLVITVTYRGNPVVVSNAPFQFTPYAKAAENGVPTGTIVAFAGAEGDVPIGWTLCDGKALATVPGSLNLRNLIGPNAPNLKGMFLRGTGQSPVNFQQGPVLRGTQMDQVKEHLHSINQLQTNSAGSHFHSYRDRDIAEGTSSGDYADGDGTDGRDSARDTATAGDHTHTLSGNTDKTGGAESRPVSYGVNYIIKL